MLVKGGISFWRFHSSIPLERSWGAELVRLPYFVTVPCGQAGPAIYWDYANSVPGAFVSRNTPFLGSGGGLLWSGYHFCERNLYKNSAYCEIF
jgi:hypothetical protein